MMEYMNGEGRDLWAGAHWGRARKSIKMFFMRYTKIKHKIYKKNFKRRTIISRNNEDNIPRIQDKSKL